MFEHLLQRLLLLPKFVYGLDILLTFLRNQVYFAAFHKLQVERLFEL